jgi:hypothetical protein
MRITEVKRWPTRRSILLRSGDGQCKTSSNASRVGVKAGVVAEAKIGDRGRENKKSCRVRIGKTI